MPRRDKGYNLDVSLPDNLRSALDAICRHTGRSRVQITTEAISEYLAGTPVIETELPEPTNRRLAPRVPRSLIDDVDALTVMTRRTRQEEIRVAIERHLRYPMVVDMGIAVAPCPAKPRSREEMINPWVAVTEDAYERFREAQEASGRSESAEIELALERHLAFPPVTAEEQVMGTVPMPAVRGVGRPAPERTERGYRRAKVG